MTRRRADNQHDIPQCPAYFDYQDGLMGPMGCFRLLCCLEREHDGGHENDLAPWPTPEMVAAEGFVVFDPRKHEHYCACGALYACNDMVCARPLLCDKCKGGQNGPKELAASV